jgi:serine/threonine protein kinase
MPVPPPPFKKPNAPPSVLEAAVEVDVDFDDDRSGSHARPIAQAPRRDFPSAPAYESSAGPSSSGPNSGKDAYAAGDVIVGKFRLKSVIGRGGMGSVWLAHNLALDIDVAIKLIRRDRAAPGAAGRLLQEARAAARLRHPVIVRVSDFGETQRGDPFIVMELLHGESLSAIIARKGRLGPAVAVQTLLPVASALVEAHAKGIVHRDLKPDNILLVTDESGSVTPKVVDFGIAKVMYGGDIDRQVTMAGEVLGSPDYMSPEQARGDEDVGEGTDVWALSVLLYEAITGRRPFDGPNYNALIAAILTVNPMPASEYCECDGDLWSIIARGLEKDATTRWSTMRDLGTALAAWAVDRGIEDDLTGTSIAKQWIIGKSRRLFTVFPDGEPMPPYPSPSRPSIESPTPMMGRPSIPDRASAPDRLSIPSRPSFGPLPPISAPPSIPGAGAGRSSFPSVSDDWVAPPFRKSRAPWLVLAVVLVLGATGFVTVMALAPKSPTDPAASAPVEAPSPSAALGTQPTVAPSAIPADTVTGDAKTASAPSSTSSAKPATTVKQPKKPTAPKVPQNIKF